MKKIFTLLTAAVCALQLMAVGTASDPYFNVSKYATIDEAGATVDGMETIYKYTQAGSGYWLTLSNYGVMKTDETQNWFTNEVTDADTGSQFTNAWTATDVFQGPSAYFGENPAYTAKYKQPAKKQTFYVTFCTQVKQYAYHRSNSSYYIFKMEIFECTKNADGSITEGTTPIETLQNSVIGTEVLTSQELDPEKIYKVVLTNQYSYLYEIAFKTPGEFDGEITTPVAYDVTDIGEQAAFMHWSPCPGAKSYSLRTYPCDFDGLTFRETFDRFTADVDPDDWQSLDAYTDIPEWQGYGLNGADGGVMIENNGSITAPMSNEHAAFIPPYQKVYTLKFKAKPAAGVESGELLVSSGSYSQRFEISGPEQEYTFVIERGLNGSYDYMSANYTFFTFKNTYYHNPYDGGEEEDHRVIITNYKIYLGDYSQPAKGRAHKPKYIQAAWSGDTTFVHNIPADSTSFHFGYYTNEAGNQQIDMSHYNGNAYWYYDVKSVYYDGQESEWSNRIPYTWAEKWPTILDDDDDLVGVPGDVDGDGEVTANDVTALYSFLLAGDNSTIVNGDQDGDGEITSSDITTVYSILLGN